MLDIKLIRENPELLRKDLEKRKDSEKIEWVDTLVREDGEYRQLLQEVEKLRADRNSITKEINEKRKKGESIEEFAKEAKEIA